MYAAPAASAANAAIPAPVSTRPAAPSDPAIRAITSPASGIMAAKNPTANQTCTRGIRSNENMYR